MCEQQEGRSKDRVFLREVRECGHYKQLAYLALSSGVGFFGVGGVFLERGKPVMPCSSGTDQMIS